MNNVILTGRLTSDVTLRERSNTKVANFRLAIPRRKRQGEDQGAVFVDVVAFDALGTNCSKYLGKGSRISIAGRLEYGEWTQDGKPRSKHEVIAQEVEFLDPAPTEAPTTDEEQASAPSPDAPQADDEPQPSATRRNGRKAATEQELAGASA